MAFDAQTLTTLAAANGYAKLSERELLEAFIAALATTMTPSNCGFLSAYHPGGPFINVLSTGVYYPVTNYIASLTSGTVTVDKVAGTITIATAGNYRVSFSVSFTAGQNDRVEADVALNGVPTDVIAGHGSSSSNVAARDDCIAGSGILSLQAGSVLSIMAENIDSTTLTLSHVQLSVGTA